jgi:cell wall-associated NlpC family hydrolase
MKIFSVLVIFFSLIGCGSISKETTPNLKVSALTSENINSLIKVLTSVEGTKYTWGGQSKADGFDCSGLLIWALNHIGFKWFDSENGFVKDINAQNFYDYNAFLFDVLEDYSASMHTPTRGDFIFFDADNDGVIEHMSVFLQEDESGIQVIDAYSVSGKVSVRYINDFHNKNPVYGRPIVWEIIRTRPKSHSHQADKKTTKAIRS